MPEEMTSQEKIQGRLWRAWSCYLSDRASTAYRWASFRQSRRLLPVSRFSKTKNDKQ